MSDTRQGSGKWMSGRRCGCRSPRAPAEILHFFLYSGPVHPKPSPILGNVIEELGLPVIKCVGKGPKSSFCPSYRSSCLHFSFLSLDKHREWLEYLLEFAQDAAPIPNQYDKHFMERDYTGYVLALNGHKKYFCLFKPQKTVEEEEAMGSCSDLDASLHLGESRGKSSSGLGSKPIKGKLSKLSLWMERLLEGSLQKFYIPSWPDLD